MIIQSFQGTADTDVGGRADAGHGKLAVMPPRPIANPFSRSACRDAHTASTGEQALLEHILQVVATGDYELPRALVVNYYISLKTNPFVILTGAAGRGKIELARLFAEALVGRDNEQYTLLPSAGVWPGATGEDEYYRSLHEQFSSWRFLNILQEASAPSNAGKAYFVCFAALRPEELEYYFATLLQVAPDGRMCLNLPGFPADQRPEVPPNVYITATVDTATYKERLSQHVLRRAGLMEFRTPAAAAEPDTMPVISAALLPPPVGYQRLWMRAALHDITAANERLARILGADALLRLQASPALMRMLWRAGMPLNTQALHELTISIANSFDEQGCGLFDRHDQQRNALNAYDAQMVQRVLWRLHELADHELKHDLDVYLDTIALAAAQQAVA